MSKDWKFMGNERKYIEDVLLSGFGASESGTMNERLERIKLVPDMSVFIEVFDKEVPIIEVSKTQSNGTLKCSMDPRLLRRILDRHSHWNNAQVGCHIEFIRTPNYYSPDIHTALAFFHL